MRIMEIANEVFYHSMKWLEMMAGIIVGLFLTSAFLFSCIALFFCFLSFLNMRS